MSKSVFIAYRLTTAPFFADLIIACCMFITVFSGSRSRSIFFLRTARRSNTNTRTRMESNPVMITVSIIVITSNVRFSCTSPFSSRSTGNTMAKNGAKPCRNAAIASTLLRQFEIFHLPKPKVMMRQGWQTTTKIPMNQCTKTRAQPLSLVCSVTSGDVAKMTLLF